LHEYLFGLVAEPFDFAFEEVDLFGDLGVFDGKQFFDDVVNVYLYLAVHFIIAHIALLILKG